MQEEWKPIDGYEGYLISNLGRVKSLKRGREMILEPIRDAHGYLRVNLYKDGVRHLLKIHRLMATTFINNPDGLPQVNHKDGNKENNSVENLEWVTESQNTQHAWDNGLCSPPRGEQNGQHKLTQNDVDEIRRSYIKGNLMFGGKALAKKYGVSETEISRIINNTRWNVNSDNNLN